MVIHRYARAIVRSADHREITGVVAKASRHISIFLRERYDAYEPAHAYNCALYVACKNKCGRTDFFIGYLTLLSAFNAAAIKRRVSMKHLARLTLIRFFSLPRIKSDSRLRVACDIAVAKFVSP